MVPWASCIDFQIENANNMYGVPLWTAVFSIPMSYSWLGLEVLFLLILFTYV